MIDMTLSRDSRILTNEYRRQAARLVERMRQDLKEAQALLQEDA